MICFVLSIDIKTLCYFHRRRLEEETEHLRREVVQRKRVLEPKNVMKLNSELESLGKSLAELKSKH